MSKASKYKEEKILLLDGTKQDTAQVTKQKYEGQISSRECCILCWKARIITVEPIVFLYVLERYLLLLFSGLYYYQRYARDSLQQAANFSMATHFCINASYLDDHLGKGASNHVEDKATQLIFLLVVSATLTAIAATLIIGPLTDTYGRKIALISVFVGRMIGELMALIIVYYNLDLNWFIVASVISSVFGDYGVFVMAITAYVADISSLKTRLLRIGVLGLANYISTGLGTVIGGTWISEVNCNFKSVAWAPFICCLIGVLASMFVIPESLSKEQRYANRSSITSFKGLRIFWKGFMLYFRCNLLTAKLWIALLVLLLLLTIARGALLIETFFFIRQPLEWTPEQIGLFGGYNSATHGLSLLLLMPIAFAVGVTDVILAIIGILCSSLGYLFTAGVKKTWQMYAISSFQGTEAVMVPSIHSMMSKYVGKEEQGALFSFVSSVEAFATILGSAIFINLYNILHQDTYFFMAVLSFVAGALLSLIWLIEKWTRRRHQHQTTSTDEEPKSP